MFAAQIELLEEEVTSARTMQIGAEAAEERLRHRLGEMQHEMQRLWDATEAIASEIASRADEGQMATEAAAVKNRALYRQEFEEKLVEMKRQCDEQKAADLEDMRQLLSHVLHPNPDRNRM